jgi:hypothetical protein
LKALSPRTQAPLKVGPSAPQPFVSHGSRRIPPEFSAVEVVEASPI